MDERCFRSSFIRGWNDDESSVSCFFEAKQCKFRLNVVQHEQISDVIAKRAKFVCGKITKKFGG